MNISPIKSSKNQYMQNFKGGFVKVGNEYINPDKIRKIKSSFKDYGLTDIAVVVNEFGEEKKFENIHEKICQIKVYLKNNEVNDEENLMKIVNCIEEVNIKNLTLYEKYEKLKVYFELIKYFDRNIAIYILELITLVIQ